jgi:hypothetical protein
MLPRQGAGQRGAALAVVLALASAVLVIGLAMGTLSTLSLQFTTRHLEGVRAEMAARSAVARVLARLRKHDGGTSLNPLQPRPSPIAQLFPGEYRIQEGDHEVSIHFNTSTEGYSRDNLAGDAPAVGWPDQDDVARIAPFTLDLVLNVRGPSTRHRFRVGLKRVWPFALYAKQGPIALMSVPDADAPTLVDGDIYTAWVQEESEITRTGYGYGLLDEPSKVLANLEARAGYQPHHPPQHHLLIGMPLGYNTPRLPTSFRDSANPGERLYFYRRSSLLRGLGEEETSANFSPQVLVDNDLPNHLKGNFLYNHKEVGANVPPYIHPGSSMDGHALNTRGVALDPLAEIAPGSGASFESDSFQPLAIPAPPGPSLATTYGLLDNYQYDNDPPFLLGETLVLTPGENSTGGPVSTHYRIPGSVSNRQVIYNSGSSGLGPGLYVRETRAGMRLQNTVLHVEGDLDLSGLPPDPEAPAGSPEAQPLEIVGAGATVICDGQLVLGNAHINAQDQGFVLYARDIVLKGGGSFYGLMIAENSITILSQQNDLQIKGALMCAGPGGITLKGTRLKHDPEYLKSINGGGDFAIVSWKKL